MTLCVMMWKVKFNHRRKEYQLVEQAFKKSILSNQWPKYKEISYYDDMLTYWTKHHEIYYNTLCTVGIKIVFRKAY